MRETLGAYAGRAAKWFALDLARSSKAAGRTALFDDELLRARASCHMHRKLHLSDLSGRSSASPAC